MTPAYISETYNSLQHQCKFFYSWVSKYILEIDLDASFLSNHYSMSLSEHQTIQRVLFVLSMISLCVTVSIDTPFILIKSQIIVMYQLIFEKVITIQLKSINLGKFF